MSKRKPQVGIRSIEFFLLLSDSPVHARSMQLPLIFLIKVLFPLFFSMNIYNSNHLTIIDCLPATVAEATWFARLKVLSRAVVKGKK